MARLVGVDLPRDKRLEVALTYIYGIGQTRAAEALAATGVDGSQRVSDVPEADVIALRDYIDANFKVEGDLRREVAADIRRKVEIGCYQGIRHRRGLPVRGQRTHTNARTRGASARPWPAKKRPQVADASSIPRSHSSRPWSSEHTYASQEQRRAQGAPEREERGPRPRAHQEHLQQHHRPITDPTGAVIAWSSSGQVGFKGSPEVHPYAAQMAAEAAARRAIDHGMRKVDVFVKGPGSGRETAIRSLQAAGLEVEPDHRCDPRSFNGCRPPKRRRV